MTYTTTFPEREIDEFVRRCLYGLEGAHHYDHTRRVYALAMEIGKRLGANLRVLGTAALLHDIARPQEARTGISHAIIAGEMSRGLLERLGYTPDEIRAVLGAIRTHRFSEGLRPRSLEGRVLSDADKLDAMGALGVFRAIAEATMTRSNIEGFLKHADEKLVRLRSMLYTDIAREMARDRHRLLQEFVRQLKAELREAGQDLPSEEHLKV